jgi:hypothetical protein
MIKVKDGLFVNTPSMEKWNEIELSVAHSLFESKPLSPFFFKPMLAFQPITLF